MSKITFLAIACGCMAAGAGLAAWRSETPPPERKAPGNAIAAPASAPLAAVESWPARAPHRSRS